jgi:DNA-binding NtrC family response regulator
MNKEDIRILIVDDEEIMRNLFTDILTDQGYNVTTVCNGKEAEEKVKDAFFDIAFVDVHMPVMDGLSTLRMLMKKCPKSYIVMTDSMPNYLVEELQKEGAITCIHKPFHIQEVKSIVNQILEQKRKEEDGAK